MRLSFAIILTVLFAYIAHAQGSGIRGTVFDPKGDHVEDVNVILVNGKTTKVLSKTDEQGKFSVSLPTGTYTVEFRSKHGFFCPVRFVDYRIVGHMALDVVLTDPTINMDTRRCKTKTIRF